MDPYGDLSPPSLETTYKYRPLDPDRKEIRVLTVYAGKAGSNLRCSLSPISLEEEHHPKYETISYVWGKGEATQQGLLDVDG